MQSQSFGLHPYDNVRSGSVSYSFEPSDTPNLTVDYSASIKVRKGPFSATKSKSGAHSVPAAYLRSAAYAQVGYSSKIGSMSLVVTSVDLVAKTANVSIKIEGEASASGNLVLSLAGEWIALAKMADGFYCRVVLHAAGMTLNLILENKVGLMRAVLRRVGLA